MIILLFFAKRNNMQQFLSTSALGLLSSFYIVIGSCGAKTQPQSNVEHAVKQTAESAASQIGEYVVEVFQDSKGHIWFGTLQQGVARYDGHSLQYLTTKDGLPSNRVTVVREDDEGKMWFGTGEGISRYDGKTFRNYSVEDGLCDNMISNLHFDREGILWIGTWGGVCKYEGSRFEELHIPYPPVETMINPDTKDWITTITEDESGNIWFGRDGYGASIYDGVSFAHITTKDGMNSNNVQSIAQDKEGNIWIGTRVAERDHSDVTMRSGKGGLNRYNDKTFFHFPEVEGLAQADVYAVYHTTPNDLWISTVGHGVYHYKDGTFKNYEVPTATMAFLKDMAGNIWLGCAGGLYKIGTNGAIRNITTKGPWN